MEYIAPVTREGGTIMRVCALEKGGGCLFSEMYDDNNDVKIELPGRCVLRNLTPSFYLLPKKCFCRFPSSDSRNGT